MPNHSTQTPKMSRARPIILKDRGAFLSLLQAVLARRALTPGAGQGTASFWLSLGWLQIPTGGLPPGPYCPVLRVPGLDLFSGEVSSYRQTADDSDSDICPGFPGGLDTTREHLGRIQGVFSTALTWEL